MKRLSKMLLLALLTTFITISLPQNVFAQAANSSNESTNENDEYEGDYYDEEDVKLTQNGAGDQFISLKLMPLFPLNFGNQLYTGGGLSIGYHRFLSQYFAVGADVMFGYNATIGSNIFTMIPITISVTYQPYFGKFEFPITLNVGAAVENYLQYNYFPGLVLKGDIGAFYRMNENWSFGLEGQFLYLPQWYINDHSKDDYYLAIAASLCARYHF